MIMLAVFIAVVPWLLVPQLTRVPNLKLKPPESRGIGTFVPVTVILELLVAALHTGAAIPRALKAVGGAIGGPDGQALIKTGRQLELGAPWERAWRQRRAALLPIADALRPAWEVGASPTASLRAAGEAVQRRQLEGSRLAAARLGVRLVLPLGLCLLPAFVLIGLIPVLLSLGSGLFGS